MLRPLIRVKTDVLTGYTLCECRCGTRSIAFEYGKGMYSHARCIKCGRDGAGSILKFDIPPRLLVILHERLVTRAS